MNYSGLRRLRRSYLTLCKEYESEFVDAGFVVNKTRKEGMHQVVLCFHGEEIVKTNGKTELTAWRLAFKFVAIGFVSMNKNFLITKKHKNGTRK